MEEYRILDEEVVLAELKFAMEHKINFSAHKIDELLHPIDVQSICDKLKIQANIHASFITEGPIKRAYYILDFYTKNGSIEKSIGTYFGKDLVSSGIDMEFEPEEEDED